MEHGLCVHSPRTFKVELVSKYLYWNEKTLKQLYIYQQQKSSMETLYRECVPELWISSVAAAVGVLIGWTI